MISLILNMSNPTRHTYCDNVIYMKGIEPFMVRYERLEITTEPILGTVYTSSK